MTRKQTIIRCIAWYVAALVLASLPYLVFREWTAFPGCLICFPSPLLWPAMALFTRPGTIPNQIFLASIIVAGYILHMAVAAIAISTRKPAVHRACYLIFCGLLVLDVCGIWFGPILAYLIAQPGE